MILVCGGSGFVGSHLVRQLCQDGFAVRCLVRNPVRAESLFQPGVQLVQGDITQPASLTPALEGVTAVINLVGIIQEAGGATFQKIHVGGTQNLVSAAQQAGVRRFVYISALGTRENAASRYHQSKYAAEQLVILSGLSYTIFRPSVMYGAGGEFIRLLFDLVRGPVIPVIGRGENLMQPLYVGDLARCLSLSLSLDEVDSSIWEIAGKEPMTYFEMLRKVRNASGKGGAFIRLPLWLVRPMVRLMEGVLSRPPLTSDQLLMLQEDNVCDVDRLQGHFAISLVEFDEWLQQHRAGVK